MRPNSTVRGGGFVNEQKRLGRRAVAATLVLGQVLIGVPVTAAPAKPAPPPVKVNRTVPKVAPPPAMPIFSDAPSAQEITRARVFAEALVPVGGTPSPDENARLAATITAYLRSGATEDVSSFAGFLKAHPETPWRASILT